METHSCAMRSRFFERIKKSEQGAFFSGCVLFFVSAAVSFAQPLNPLPVERYSDVGNNQYTLEAGQLDKGGAFTLTVSVRRTYDVPGANGVIFGGVYSNQVAAVSGQFVIDKFDLDLYKLFFADLTNFKFSSSTLPVGTDQLYTVTASSATGGTPTITLQPRSQQVAVGAAVIFFITASGSPPLSYQWKKDGVPIVGATSETLALSNVQVASAGAYTVLVTGPTGLVATSSPATLAVAAVPTITTSPASVTMPVGSGTAVFNVTATTTGAVTYQWRKDGSNLTNGINGVSGATGPTLVIQGTSLSSAGSYSVVVSNASGGRLSGAAVLTITDTGEAARLSNLSVVTSLASRSDSFSLGYVVTGASASNPKPLVIRAAGPSLGALGYPGTLDDPKLELFAGPSKTGENEDWGGSAATTNAMAAVGGFAYAGPASRDAAVATNITSSDNSVKVTVGANSSSATGAVIAEVYDATPSGTFTNSTPKLVNFSVIKSIAAGGSLTLGFTIGPAGGRNAKTVLIRVIGPGLAAVGLTSGTLGDPQLKLYNGASEVIATNDDWGANPVINSTGSRVNAFSVGTAATKDSMLLMTLPPGAYTATATGNANTSGLAIVEVYEVP